MIKTIRCQISLNDILDKALNGFVLSREEVIFLLKLSRKQDLKELFRVARLIREKHFSNKIFLYGFIYFSTWCRNDCSFCFYRRTNSLPHRYRKSPEEILQAAVSLANSGVHLIDLTMGEDPYFRDRKGVAELAHIVREVKRLTNLHVMISPGVASEKMLQEVMKAGADWYACYQETHNRNLFTKLRLSQSYDLRYHSKKTALELGMLAEEGIMVGVGESWSDIATSLEKMNMLGAQQVRVMSFVPQDGSAMSEWPTPNRQVELKVIAILRLLFHDRLIPASLDVDGIEGLQARLNAGANVITSLIPPYMGLAGVAQSTKDINQGARTVKGILPVLKDLDLKAASKKEYKNWVLNKRSSLTIHCMSEIGG
ncbi:methylornithine synthase PylB [Desulfoscipio gibsoniae]|uniref:Pyrrolysine biosynthesis radical SAM protein n=1 Tax=Desulfoscipio gibsoniae DSM 7213 TaxID=767817 RepID=R4KKM5_9FIRM|nr:methylornithine synthase PylB [Desulfoscipio gibsoniae]AGL03214.1 pyrrolysine biosynthesis radical SAM protein [Desulfoscipio gibsoniae DSM 7213]